jgi:ssRNA-specific RNase YbeY (16S rRNA maturation enzyme)
MAARHLEQKLNRVKRIVLKALRREGADFDFHVVSNRTMEGIRSELMAREDFKGREARKIAKEKMVNVLAFPEPEDFPEPGRKKTMLGEIYLNGDFGAKDFETLGPLLIHGLLHLLGYLHWTERDTIKMQKLEKKLWALIS